MIASGTDVKTGQILIKMECSEITKTLELAKSLEQIAYDVYQRYLKLFAAGLITKIMLDDHHSKWLDSKKAVQNAKNEYEKYIFRAAFDGIVGISKYQIGSHVEKGEELMTIYNPTDLIIKTFIPQDFISRIKIGQKVIIDDNEFKLDEVQQFVDSKTQMFPAIINYLCAKCVMGTVVYVDLVLSEKEKVIVIPRHVIMIKNGINHVYILKDNKAILTKIELGENEKDLVEVKSGLAVGEKLIINGFQSISDGQNVKNEGEEQ